MSKVDEAAHSRQNWYAGGSQSFAYYNHERVYINVTLAGGQANFEAWIWMSFAHHKIWPCCLSTAQCISEGRVWKCCCAKRQALHLKGTWRKCDELEVKSRLDSKMLDVIAEQSIILWSCFMLCILGFLYIRVYSFIKWF